MSNILIIIGCIVLFMFIAGFALKMELNKNDDISKPNEKRIIKNAKGEEIEVPDYENDPKYSYMSCNKYNPDSHFYYNKPKPKPLKVEKKSMLYYAHKGLWDFMYKHTAISDIARDLGKDFRG